MKTQINKVRNESGDITADTTELSIQRILRDCYEQLYANKLYNQEEMGKFLETYKLPRLNHEETENMNRPRVSKKIESVIKNLPAFFRLGFFFDIELHELFVYFGD